MKQVTKRDGSLVTFDQQKIVTAIEKAMADTPIGVDPALSVRIADEIASKPENLSVEQIQDLVENKLMASKRKDVARAYIIYRDNHAKRRNLPQDLAHRYEHFHRLVTGEDEESNKENSNKDTRIIPTMRDYIAGFTCREMATKVILPPDIAKAHEEGIIHYHENIVA